MQDDLQSNRGLRPRGQGEKGLWPYAAGIPPETEAEATPPLLPHSALPKASRTSTGAKWASEPPQSSQKSHVLHSWLRGPLHLWTKRPGCAVCPSVTPPEAGALSIKQQQGPSAAERAFKPMHSRLRPNTRDLASCGGLRCLRDRAPQTRSSDGPLERHRPRACRKGTALVF